MIRHVGITNYAYVAGPHNSNMTTGVTADQRSALRALAELGLDFELTVMPFPPHYRVKEYMAVNPLGNQPARAGGFGTTTSHRPPRSAGCAEAPIPRERPQPDPYAPI